MNASFKICAVLLLTAIITLMLRDKLREYRILIVLAGIGVTVYFVLDSLTGLFDYVTGDAFPAGNIASVLMKCLAVAYVSEFCSSVCRDAGEETLCLCSSLIGKTEVIVLVFPMIKELFEKCFDVIK